MDELKKARNEASMYFGKFCMVSEKLKRLQSRHRRQQGIVSAARAVIQTWDDNEWAEHAGDGELADAIEALRKRFEGKQKGATHEPAV